MDSPSAISSSVIFPPSSMLAGTCIKPAGPSKSCSTRYITSLHTYVPAEYDSSAGIPDSFSLLTMLRTGSLEKMPSGPSSIILSQTGWQPLLSGILAFLRLTAMTSGVIAVLPAARPTQMTAAGSLFHAMFRESRATNTILFTRRHRYSLKKLVSKIPEFTFTLKRTFQARPEWAAEAPMLQAYSESLTNCLRLI